MANYPSAEKRHRQNLKRRERNRIARSRTRTAIKKALQLAHAGSKDEALAQVRLVNRYLDKDAIHGIVHKNNAQRRISRLSKRVNAILTAS